MGEVGLDNSWGETQNEFRANSLTPTMSDERHPASLVVPAAVLGGVSVAREAWSHVRMPATRLGLAVHVVRRAASAATCVACSATLYTSAAQYMRRHTQRVMHAEWAVAVVAGGGGALTIGLAAAARSPPAMARWTVPLLVFPSSIYMALDVREKLQLFRAARPASYEAITCALISSLPLLALPSSLGALCVAPLCLPPVCSAWLSEAGSPDEATLPPRHKPAVESADTDLAAAVLLFGSPGGTSCGNTVVRSGGAAALTAMVEAAGRERETLCWLAGEGESEELETQEEGSTSWLLMSAWRIRLWRGGRGVRGGGGGGGRGRGRGRGRCPVTWTCTCRGERDHPCPPHAPLHVTPVWLPVAGLLPLAPRLALRP